jgi:hypothetical protein
MTAMNPESAATPTRPPAVSQRQVLQERAATLLGILRHANADKPLAEEEVRQLRDWLVAFRGTDLQAIGFLREAMDSVVTKRAACDGDLLDIYLAIGRAIPVARGFDEGGTWREEPMSAAQQSFVNRFRGSLAGTATKGEAAYLLERLLNELPLSARQVAVAKFWGHATEDQGPLDVLDRLEAFYAQDPNRRRAWDLFCAEVPEGEREMALIRPGTGEQYCERIKAGGVLALPRLNATAAVRPQSGPAKSQRSLLVGAAIAAGIALMLLGANTWSARSRAVGGDSSQRGSVGSAAVAPVDAAKAAVMALKLTSIVTLEEPCAVIDGQPYRVGDLVDATHKIRIVRIDGSAGAVDFVDPSGRVLSRSLR